MSVVRFGPAPGFQWIPVTNRRSGAEAVVLAEGRGVGLAISRSIITAAGGIVAVDPAVSVGVRFRLSLPVAADLG